MSLPEDVRAVIAARLLPGIDTGRLGNIVLADHQVAAVRRLATLLAAHGGALLADDVGLGKTFVALAVARTFRGILIVAPAGLRDMWRAALARSDVTADVVTYEALSRRKVHLPTAGIVILDEAHHARSATAKRHAQLAALTARARTLLLTATPLPNHLGELRTLFALFLGERAMSLSEDALRTLIVRRTAASVPSAILPRVLPPKWIDVCDDTPCLRALERLPPPVTAADAGDGGALLLLGLMRQWSSSRAALEGALRHRRDVAVAIESALLAGRIPTTRELAAWPSGDDAIQLAFPELAAAGEGEPAACARMLADLRRHQEALTQVLSMLREPPDPDATRAARILEVRDRHPGERLVCFTGYARTADAYWRQLRNVPGVAHLTGAGGDIASGRLGRADVLARFAPRGQRVPEPRAIERIALLITTDLLAEGVDLRDATVVVHLDLPWSPARLEQRVGRCRRLGSPAASITVYAMRPPAQPEVVLALERRLRAKMDLASRTIGAPSASLPADVAPARSPVPGCIHNDRDSRRSPVMPPGEVNAESTSSPPGPLAETEWISLVFDRVASWCTTSTRGVDAATWNAADDAPRTCAVEASFGGWLALVRVGDRCRLFAAVEGRVGDSAPLLDRAVQAAEGQATTCSPQEVRAALASATRAAGEWAATLCLDAESSGTPVRSRVLARIRRAYDRTAPHAKPQLAALAAGARRTASGRLPKGVEHALAELCDAEHDDAAFVRAVAALGVPPEPEPGTAPSVDALIVFVPTGGVQFLSAFSRLNDAELTQ